MASYVLKLLNSGDADKAAVIAASTAQTAGAAFFETNVLAAIAMAKAGHHDAALEYWDKLIRSAPHKLNWLESGLKFAWQAESTCENAVKFARIWQKTLERVYISIPSANILAQLEQKGWHGNGSVGIHDGFLKGWLWLKKGEKPKIKTDLPKTCPFPLSLNAINANAEKILYKISLKLPTLTMPYEIRVTDGEDKNVAGSPVNCSPRHVGMGKTDRHADQNKPTIIIPVYDDRSATLSCIGNVLASRKKNQKQAEIIVAWDHGPDENLLGDLRKLAARKKIILIENPGNLGFLASVNNALGKITNGDVILLNSDTIPHGDWIDRLVEAGATDDAATITALSNEAELMSYPAASDRGKIQRLSQVKILDNAAKQNGKALEIPVGVGFCMLITRRALKKVGGFDGLRLFRGYGEEVDFCLRAEQAGLKNYGAYNVFVGHLGERSFGASKKALAAQNNDAIFQNFPHYRREYEKFLLLRQPKKLREAISRSALTNLPKVKMLEMRPWSMRFLPPWAKDEKCKPDHKGAVLFIQPGPRPRALLRVWSEIPIAEMNFDLERENDSLIRAINDLGCEQAVVYGTSDSLLSKAEGLGLKASRAQPLEQLEVFDAQKNKRGIILLAPPATINGWRNLRELALRQPESLFYVFYVDTLWKGAPRPENIQEMPRIEDYRPLRASAFLLVDNCADASAWRHWLDKHYCAHLPMFKAGND